MASTARTGLLCAVLHGYMAIVALLFQTFEYKPVEDSHLNINQIKLILSEKYNVSSADATRLIELVAEANYEDHKIKMASAWISFSASLWFVMTLFTTVGTGHLVPQTFGGRLFCMLSALVGIPLYALFLKNAGELIIHVLRKMIEAFEMAARKHKSSDVKHMNIKVLISAFVLMTTTILVGALGAHSFKWSYFEGIYFCFISLSTVGFGDLVPKVNDTQRKVSSVIYMFYNIVGLAIVACFISSLINSMEEITEIWKSLKVEVGLRKTFYSRTCADSRVASERKTEVDDVAQSTKTQTQVIRTQTSQTQASQTQTVHH